MFGIFRLFYSLIFLCNSIVILDQSRFLKKIGLSLEYTNRTRISGMQLKIIEVIRAIRTVCGIPLIVLNIIGIFYEIVLG